MHRSQGDLVSVRLWCITTSVINRISRAAAGLDKLAGDGQDPLAEPEVGLLDTLTFTTALPPPGQGAERDDGSEVLPYHRRKAHDGFDDSWKPRNVANGKWITIGTRPLRALLEMNQDVYDEAAAVANGFRTWLAAVDEVHARSERIVQTRHWVAPVSKPVDALPRLFEELEFRILWTR